MFGFLRSRRHPLSDHYDGKRFHDPDGRGKRSFKAFLSWRRTRAPGSWPDWVENRHADRPPPRVDGDALRVAFVNHATFLIQTRGLNILTDPLWSERASPVRWAGPKRVRAPGIAFDDLPKIDLVLVSHGHYDHLDKPTLKRLWRRDRPRVLTPLGQDRAMRPVPAEALDWGEGVALADGVRATLERAQHWSARGPFDANKALWGAFAIETPGGAIYFAGDTGYGPHFQQAAAKYGGFRLALLPIGAYEPRWFMEFQHMTPDEAVKAHKDLRAARSLAFHHGTFQLADDGFDAPLIELAKAREMHQVAPDVFRALENGETWAVP